MKALIIVDMQKIFVNEASGLRINGATDIIPNITEILSYFRENKLPVFHIVRTKYYTQLGKKIIPFEEGEIVEGLKPLKGEYVIEKKGSKNS